MPAVLEEKDAIRELMAQYCFHIDNGEFDDWLQLFTADGVFDLGARGRLAGHDALRKFVQSIPLTNGLPMIRHCVMNSIVNVDGNRATARSYLIVVQGGETLGVSIAGRYEDRLAKIGDAWRFTERKVHFDLMSKR
jgi:3-phenylpropionate/cinnamic acid dioxygenase small subunit